MASVKFVTGLQDAYNALSSTDYDTNTLYFITDSQRLYKGDVLIANVSEGNVVFTTTEPEFDTSDTGVLYVYTDTSGSTSILVKGESSMVTVSGGEVQDGAITSISAFDPGVVTTITELSAAGKLPSNDNSIPTSGAVQAAIDAAIGPGFIDVTFENPPEGSTYNLKFTSANESTKTVNIPKDSFVSSGVYEAPNLILTLNNGTQVTIDMTDLVPSTVAMSDVAVDFVEPSGGASFVTTVDVGNIPAGTTILTEGDPGEGEIVAANLKDLLSQMFSQDINPTVTQPSASVTLSNSGAKEVGTQFTPTYSASLNPGSYVIHYGSDQTRTQPTEVTATSYAVTDTNSGSKDTQTGSFDAFTVDDDTNYRVSVTINHTAGAIPLTFLGNNYTSGQIGAGSKSANSAYVTGFRNCWWGYKGASNLISPATGITADQVKALGNANRNRPSSLSATDMQQIFVAIPANSGVNTLSIVDTGTNLPVTVNGRLTVQIGGVDNYSPINYYVFYSDNAAPAPGTTTYSFTWTNV